MITTRILAISSILLYGCGSTTDRQTQIVETQRTTTAPLVVDSPFGQFVVQPAQVTVQRTQREVETTTKTIDMPEVGSVITAAAAGTGWGGIISGIVGLGTAAFAAKKALDNGRQRDEMIAGVEKAKDAMDDTTWENVKGKMASVQSPDTQKVIYDKTP